MFFSFEHKQNMNLNVIGWWCRHRDCRKPTKLILIEFFLFNLFFLQNFNGDEFLKCLMELVNIEKEWVPKEESCSLYVRPTIIGTGVS